MNNEEKRRRKEQREKKPVGRPKTKVDEKSSTPISTKSKEQSQALKTILASHHEQATHSRYAYADTTAKKKETTSTSLMTKNNDEQANHAYAVPTILIKSMTSNYKQVYLLHCKLHFLLLFHHYYLV